MNSLAEDIRVLIRVLIHYFQHKVVYLGKSLENFKNLSVDILMSRRGILQKRVWHGSMIVLSALGILTSGIFGGATIVSSSFPGVAVADPRFASASEPSLNDPVLNSLNDTHTLISEKPRDTIITYQVKSGDTLSGIANKFNISTDTIKWENDLGSVDSIKPGDNLKILPVSGVAHTVKSGDTLASVAKTYKANSQAILDFPFNDIPDDLSLKIGQVLIVPDGVPVQAVIPVAAPGYGSGESYLAEQSSTFTAPGGANFIWPTHGILTQYFAWYHPADDIANPAAPSIIAADGGTISYAGWDTTGYGNRVDINHGNGYLTRYAHMSNIYVTLGMQVSRGQTIGQMGSTGRSTGTHLHFEIRYNGIALNPLSILK